jgi:hypothetical protein
MKKLEFPVLLFLIPLLVGLVAGCGSSSSGKPATSVPATNSQGAPNYANSSNWLSLPAKVTKKVDVFFLYPTAYNDTSPSVPMICAINNPEMQSGAKASFSRTATAFAPLANIYAPWYRQANVRVLALPQSQQQSVVGGVPTSDALAAFDYFIKHYNKERPFILAGHSQGSNVMINLLAQYMKKYPKVYKRMVTAYIPGYSVTPEYLAQNPELKFVEGPDDTGVIVSYNTEAPTIQGTNPVVLPGAMVINPITWTRTETPAAASQNRGSLAVNTQTGYAVLDAQGNPQKVMNQADAQINTSKGVLICSTVNPGTLDPGNKLVAAGIYHSYDYPFYYFDIRANAANRIARFLNKK